MFCLKKIILKIISIPLWILFFFLSIFTKYNFILLRFFIIPGAFTAVAGTYTHITKGEYIMALLCVAIGIIAVIGFIVAPKIATWVIDTKDNLKDTIFFPVNVRAKHKFTVDYTYWENN